MTRSYNRTCTKLLICFALAAPFASGCAVFTRVPPLEPLAQEKHTLYTIHYVAQQEGWDCGPACLATVLRHYGIDVSIEQLSREMKQVNGGTIPIEMIYTARKHGAKITMYESGLNDLRKKIIAEQPLILFLHPMPAIVKYTGLRRGHWVVAVGFDDSKREVTIHSGDTAYDTISYRQLQLEWGRAGFLMLLIEPHREIE